MSKYVVISDVPVVTEYKSYQFDQYNTVNRYQGGREEGMSYSQQG